MARGALRCGCALLLGGLALFGGFAQAACTQSLHVIRTRDLPEAVDERVLLEVAKRAGCPVRTTVVDYRISMSRRMELLSLGKTDVLVGASWLAEREVFSIYSVPVRYETIRLWVLAG